MTNMEKWNEIVETYKNLIDQRENVIQFIWEHSVCQNCFGFPRENIISQRPVQMGVSTKFADIVLKKNDIEECVIELKQSSLTQGRDQLFSYLIQIRNISIGILACDKLHLYYFDYMSMDANDSRPNLEIPFEKDNPDGEKFVELFNYESFDRENVKQWILDRYSEIREARMQTENSRRNIETIINALNDALVSDLLKKHFVNDEGFPENDVNAALETMQVSVESRLFEADGDIEVPANFNGNTALHYYVGGHEVSSRVFESKLIEKKSAKRKYYYGDGQTKIDNWNALSFNGNLSGNIHSASYWRKRVEKRLVRVDFCIE